ncbi:hypothetical protein F7725_004852 [Dissostichus mawsoni]|uniref:Uncharacterized protein n=1 Tax=Dissostichus mawsoni TaxID=36200 RepID=A0A7J5XML9_DISMA|nr:hypothetical protein F7725_004852 [Dissostichus mawsoni]
MGGRSVGDVGLPGPSGTPGDGSLRSEQTLTIYKGDKGDAGSPGEPGQPLINGIVEFVGFPKGDKGLQVC